MELGEKIRQARLEMGLSQRQLCGDVITRNMLSQIENGSAHPSMDTLRYLADRLGMPVSYFLDEQAVVSPNQALMEAARQHFAAGQYGQAVACLEGYREPDCVFDGEKSLLEALSLMHQAQQALAEGKPVYAQALLEKAAQAGDRTAYFTPAERRQWVLLMGQAQPERVQALAAMLPDDDRELLLRARAALQGQDFVRCAQLLEAVPVHDAQWHLLRGQAAMGVKDYALATQHLHRAEEAYPQPCFQALEGCYRELEDYKMAYFYACKQREG